MKLKQVRVDGYKNLINAVLDLGDFNVLVGPNNSGKSNTLEAIQIVWPICFGDDKLRQRIFRGMTPLSRGASSLCHLRPYVNKPLKIGLTFDINDNENIWKVDYDLEIQCDPRAEKTEETGFISETLSAKKPSATGPASKYIKRRDKTLEIVGTEHPISKDISSLSALKSLYPDYNKLPPEMRLFVEAIYNVGNTNVFAVSPASLVASINSELDIRGLRISSFDLPFAVDRIKEKGEYYELFKETLCDILNLKEVRLEAIVPPLSNEKEKEGQTNKKMRFLIVKKDEGSLCFIDECSDGTFTAAAIIAAVISVGPNKPIVCIEEPENYLHPAALQKLLGFLQDHADKWPVLITTHSPYLLNCVKNVEDISVAVVDDNGATNFKKVENTKQLRDYLKSGFMSIGDMLVSNFEEVLKEK